MSLLVVETCVQKSFLCILFPYHHLMKSETSIEQSVRLVFGVTYIVSFLALCSAIDNIFFFDTHIIEPDLKYLYSNKMYCKNPFIDYTARETAVSSVSVDKKILRIIDSIFLLFSLGCLHWLMTLMWVWPRPNKINYFSPLFPIHSVTKLMKLFAQWIGHPTAAAD